MSGDVRSEAMSDDMDFIGTNLRSFSKSLQLFANRFSHRRNHFSGRKVTHAGNFSPISH